MLMPLLPRLRDVVESKPKESPNMCVSCNCGSPNDDHGDSRNITMDKIEKAAQASGKSPQQVAGNIQKGVSQAAQ
jgi:hypothetical protein